MKIKHEKLSEDIKNSILGRIKLEEFCEAAGIHRRSIRHYMNGERGMELVTLRKIVHTINYCTRYGFEIEKIEKVSIGDYMLPTE